LEEVGHHFTQASSTPFLQDPLISIFSETGSTAKAFEEVLEGTFIPPDQCHDFTKKLLATLQ